MPICSRVCLSMKLPPIRTSGRAANVELLKRGNAFPLLSCMSDHTHMKETYMPRSVTNVHVLPGRLQVVADFLSCLRLTRRQQLERL